MKKNFPGWIPIIAFGLALGMHGCFPKPKELSRGTPATPSLLPATVVPSVAPANIQTSEPTPTWTPIPRILFPQPPMTVDVTKFAELRRYGNGVATSMKLQPEGDLLALAGGVGIWLYDRHSLDLQGHMDGHAGQVNALDWSPDGRYLAAANNNGTVQVWDVARQMVVRVFDRHRAPVVAVAWSPDGSRIASGGEDNWTRIWDADSTEELQNAEGDNDGECGSCKTTFNLAWSPDGEIIAIVTNRMVRIWELGQAETLDIYQAWWIRDIDWSPDGQSLAIAGYDGLWFADRETWDGQLIPLEPIKQPIQHISWSGAGDKIAGVTVTFLGASSHVFVLDVDSRESNGMTIEHQVSTFQVNNPIAALEWTPEEQVILGGNGMVWFWDTIDHLTSHTLYDFWGAVDIDLSPDGRRIVTSNGRLRSLIPEGKEWMYLGINRDQVAWSPDDRHIAFRDERGLQIYDVDWGDFHSNIVEVMDELKDTESFDMAWSPDGKTLALKKIVNFNDSQVQLYQLPVDDKFVDLKLELLQTFPITPTEFLVEDILWSPDGTLVAFGDDFEIKVFDVAANQLINSVGSEVEWDVWHEATWSPDGKYLAVYWDRSGIRVIDTTKWQETSEAIGTKSNTYSIEFSPDSHYLVGGDRDGLLTIWDAKTGRAVKTLEGHTSWVRRVIWSATGNFITSVSQDGTIRIWGLPEE